jgi:hypothetical protein
MGSFLGMSDTLLKNLDLCDIVKKLQTVRFQNTRQ